MTGQLAGGVAGVLALICGLWLLYNGKCNRGGPADAVRDSGKDSGIVVTAKAIDAAAGQHSCVTVTAQPIDDPEERPNPIVAIPTRFNKNSHKKNKISGI